MHLQQNYGSRALTTLSLIFAGAVGACLGSPETDSAGTALSNESHYTCTVPYFEATYELVVMENGVWAEVEGFGSKDFIEYSIEGYQLVIPLGGSGVVRRFAATDETLAGRIDTFYLGYSNLRWSAADLYLDNLDGVVEDSDFFTQEMNCTLERL